jgi:hypothetical protein
MTLPTSDIIPTRYWLLVSGSLCNIYRLCVVVGNDMIWLRWITLILCVVRVDLRLCVLRYPWGWIRGVVVVVALIGGGVLMLYVNTGVGSWENQVTLTLYPDMAGEGGCSCFGRIELVFLVRVVVLEGR